MMKRVQTTIMQPQHNTIMRRVIHPRDSPQNSVQMNAVNKVNNLSSISVTSTTQPRVRQTIYASSNAHITKCFTCDENIMGAPTILKECETHTSHEKVTKKLAKLVGDDFCVVVSEEDYICRRCLTLFNTMDKYEFDLENVRTRLRGFINKKYSIDEQEEPPAKIQRLNEPQSNRWQNANSTPATVSTTSATTAAGTTTNKEAAENQLKHLQSTPNKRNATGGPVKLYKCIACDFKTTDLNAFQPHSSVCKGQQTKTSTSSQQNRVGVAQRISYTTPNSSGIQQRTSLSGNTQQVGRTTIVRNNTATPTAATLACPYCDFKTADSVQFNDHHRNHHVKLRPFKCRMCLERFATREAAQVHAKIHSNNSLKCGICNRQFVKRETFDAHMKVHENEKFKISQQQEVIVLGKQQENRGGRGGAVATQKPLTDIIKEALSEEDQDGVNEFIEFHSCNLCSLTFVNKKLYAQHMKTHETPSKVEPQVSFVKGGSGGGGGGGGGGKSQSGDTMGDLESIFEKMHSETSHHVTTSNGSLNDSKNVLITTQESGGITYNITIPQDDIPLDEKNVRVDMPSLSDEPAPVSMPSLHDDENTQSSQEQHGVEVQEGEAIPMDLEELQQAAEGQQLKFIVDENGQFLQLDNHILTTDADGNQILVQGTDQEQLQHLLQSVGVDGNQVLVQLQDNGEGIDGEGTTLQFGEGGQGQMILVQNENGESQLIDASMLQTEGGNLVLQQNADGEATLTTADGFPVSVSFSGEGADGQITVTMASTNEDGEQIFIQQPVELAESGSEANKTEEGETTMQLEESSQESTTTVTETALASSENQASSTEEKSEIAGESNKEEEEEEKANIEATDAETKVEESNNEIEASSGKENPSSDEPKSAEEK